MEGVKDYEKISIPYPGGHLPGFRLPAKGREVSTFILTVAMILSSRSFIHF
jgi:hypothetical protein